MKEKLKRLKERGIGAGLATSTVQLVTYMETKKFLIAIVVIASINLALTVALTYGHYKLTKLIAGTVIYEVVEP